MEEINLGIISRMKEEAGAYSEVVSKVLDSVAESLSQEEVSIYTSGAPNIFKYPELSGGDKGQRADQHAGGEEESRYDYVG